MIPQMQHIAERTNNPVKINQCIQCHNEEEFIGITLASIYNEVDKIFVLEGAVQNRPNSTEDGHSTDRTIEIIEDFKQNRDPDNKVTVISINRHWKNLEEMKNTFLDMSMHGEVLLINDCLVGNRCVPVKINGKIQVLSLKELFDFYIGSGYSIRQSGDRECIDVDNLETLSVIQIDKPEHTLYRHERGLKLGCFYKSNLKETHLNVVNNFEVGNNIFPSNNPNVCSVTQNTRKKLKTLKNAVASWQKVSTISRVKTNKDIIRISQKYGETECTIDHRIGINADDLQFETAENFQGQKLLQIGQIKDSDCINNIRLYDWINDSTLYLRDGKIKHNSSYEKNRWPWIKNELFDDDLENFCELLGFYVAEGSVESKQLKDWRIAESSKQILEMYHQYLLNISDHKFNSGSSVKNNGNIVHYIGITSPVIIRLFADLCGIGSHDKKIPSFIFHLEKKFKLAFLKGYNTGDGHKTKSGSFKSDTVSGKLHGGLCLLQKQLMMQYCVSHREPEQYNDEFNHSRVFSLLKDKKLEQITRFSTKKINLGKTEDYVYDLTVPITHNFCDADGMIVVHNCDETYKPEDVIRIRRFFDLEPTASELIPNFLHFYGDLEHVAKPGPEWNCQHQRIIKFEQGMRYNSHPILTDRFGHCTYFSPHYQHRRFVPKKPINIYHYGYARPNMNEVMKQKKLYYDQELTKHNNANKKFDEKLENWLQSLEPVLEYDGDHPTIMKDFSCDNDVDFNTVGHYMDDEYYSKVFNGEETGNIWLCMNGLSQPRISFYHNGIDV